jgi:putative methyltransferase (TIGR04325 family)
LKEFFKYFISRFLKKQAGEEKDGTPEYGWFGSYTSWEVAKAKCSGYDSENILNKVKSSVLKVIRGEAEYERDSVAFDKHEYSEDFLKALQAVVKNNELNVIDFGGSLGSAYFQYKRFFAGVKINWIVVEQKHFVDAGNKEIKNDELKFSYTIEDALSINRADTILLSSVLPYIEKPSELAEKIQSFGFENIIIDRNAFIEGEKQILTVQIVPEFIYKASYPAWFFNERNFVNLFSDKYVLKMQFMSPFALPVMLKEGKAYWKGFLFKRK